MAPRGGPHPLRILARDLAITLVLGALLFVFFDLVYNHVISIPGVTGSSIILFEAGAIILVAFLFSRALTSALNAFLTIRGTISRGHVIRILINLLIATGAVLALFTLAGVSIESIFLGSALAGIVLGLAAQTVLSNLFAGLLLIVADPFRPGDRVNIVSGGLGAMPPSYPHEMMYPLYGGVVEDIGLTYTIIRQDSGGLVKVPNAVVLAGIVQQPEVGVRTIRVRMTFPQTIAVATVEAALGDLRAAMQDSKNLALRLSLDVCDISATTWDGVVIVVTQNLNEPMVRDRVLRAVLARILTPAASAKPTA